MAAKTRRRVTVTGVATALTVGSLGLVAPTADALVPVGPPSCTSAGLTTSGPTANGDGSFSQVVVSGDSPFTVPSAVTSLILDVCGAQGGAGGTSGGLGGRSQGTLAVAPGDALFLRAGGSSGAPGGGGAAGTAAGAGGGFSAIYTGSTAARAHAVLVAGGGGGGAAAGTPGFGGGAGGAGGGLVAAPGAFGSGSKAGGGGGGGDSSIPTGGTGGTGGFGGPAGSPGGPDQGGAGASGGGGGGGGYYGGGGGGNGFSGNSGGGGGGSGYVDPVITSGSTTGGARTGAGVVVVTYTPEVTVTTNASGPITVGSGSISDSATVTTSSAPAPTGTVRFDVYGPSDSTCTGPPVDSSQGQLANGDAQSTPYTPTTNGTYRFVATYSGDGNHPAASGACNDSNESVQVSDSSSVTTQTSTSAAAMGDSVSDSATVTTGSGAPPTGTVTFTVYQNDVECSPDSTVFTSTKTVSGGDAQSDPYTPTDPGTYYFIATYSGDANTSSSSGSCDDPAETTQFTLPASSVATNASPDITFGSGSISDSATVTTTSGSPPTGTVTFDIYGPDDSQCSGDPIASSTVAVVNGDAQSNPYTPRAGGVYRYIAYYNGGAGNGDPNNGTSSAACNEPNESVTVNAAASTMDTQASAPITQGGFISDTATVTSSVAVPPSGTITFDVFGPDNATCSGSPVFSSTNAVDNGDAASTPFSPSLPGVYRYIAHYSGDGTNAAVDGACNDADESTTVSQAPPQPPSPSPSPSVSPSSSPSPISSSPGTRRDLTLTVLTPTIPAGSTGRLRTTGAPNEQYSLLCYSRPSTTYVEARSGTFDASGSPVTFTLSLGRNTRCFIQYAVNPSQGASPSVVINVRTVLSLSAVRTAVRTYVFQGRNLPRVAGQLITLYRVDGAGNEIRTANLRTDSSGIYRLTRTFTGTGTFRFHVRTPQTLNNAAGVSNTITVTVH
jgi:hypothetical protein